METELQSKAANATQHSILPLLINFRLPSKVIRLRKSLLFLLCFVAFGSVTFADTVVLAPLKDNTLYEDGAGITSNGSGVYFFAGFTLSNSLRRGLIAFDLTGIPSNATVTNVSLTLYLSKTHGGSAAVTLHRTLRDWGEGASDAGEPGGSGIQAEQNDATWFHTFYDTVFWANLGGDFSSTSSATTTVSSVNTTYTWSGSGLIADVQGFVSNPATNFGWVIQGNESIAGKAHRFNTRENTVNPPRLTVTFQAPAGSPTPTPTSTPTSTPTATTSATATATATVTPTATSTTTATATATASSTSTATASGTAPSTPTATVTSTATVSSTPTPTITVTPMPTPTPTPTPTVTPSGSVLANISTRLQVGTGDNVLIGGFVISGTQPKRVILRAIGPSLSTLFSNYLRNPVLELRDASGGLIHRNDNWRSEQEKAIIGSGIPPSDDSESAIIETLPASGSAYTAIVSGFVNQTGIGLVEVYDLDPTADSRLANISTRGFVQTGNNVLIGGLIVLGDGPLRVILRGLGPTLAVPEALANPTLELHDSNGAFVGFNDDWRADQEAEIIATGLAPASDLESAMVRNLAPGFYTFVLRGVNQSSGLALIEAYALD